MILFHQLHTIFRCSGDFCRALHALQEKYKIDKLSEWKKLQPGDIIYLTNTSYSSSLNRRQNSKMQAVIWGTESYHRKFHLGAMARKKALGFARGCNAMGTFPYTCCLFCTDPLLILQALSSEAIPWMGTWTKLPWGWGLPKRRVLLTETLARSWLATELAVRLKGGGECRSQGRGWSWEQEGELTSSLSGHREAALQALFFFPSLLWWKHPAGSQQRQKLRFLSQDTFLQITMAFFFT